MYMYYPISLINTLFEGILLLLLNVQVPAYTVRPMNLFSLVMSIQKTRKYGQGEKRVEQCAVVIVIFRWCISSFDHLSILFCFYYFFSNHPSLHPSSFLSFDMFPPIPSSVLFFFSISLIISYHATLPIPPSSFLVISYLSFISYGISSTRNLSSKILAQYFSALPMSLSLSFVEFHSQPQPRHIIDRFTFIFREDVHRQMTREIGKKERVKKKDHRMSPIPPSSASTQGRGGFQKLDFVSEK